MFVDFFYLLRAHDVPVTPTSFLRLHKALNMGIINSIEDFYTDARAILVKSERYFDLYDQLFAHYFKGVAFVPPDEQELSALAKALLEEWLKNPHEVAGAFGVDPDKLGKMTPEELVKYFLDRLKEQTEEHHGGNRWIGTGGTSPVGHSGFHPGGMRVGGKSVHRSAVKVAMSRRYKDYSQDGPLTQVQIGEALKRLRRLVPSGPKDAVNIDKTIYQTMRNAGEIEIVFDRRLMDRLKVILMIDNGGWSMDPHIEVVQTLFSYARAQFKDIKTYFFHNTIYDHVWADAARRHQPERIDEFVRKDLETRIIIVGDASMANFELTTGHGRISYEERSGRPSIDRLKFLAGAFRHTVWLNPLPEEEWRYTSTIQAIGQIFPMYELTLDGLEKAIRHLMARN